VKFTIKLLNMHIDQKSNGRKVQLSKNNISNEKVMIIANSVDLVDIRVRNFLMRRMLLLSGEKYCNCSHVENMHNNDNDKKRYI